MQSPHPDFDAAAAKARHADIRREAENWRQTKDARTGWLSRQSCWLLCQVGQVLVRLGEQLESWGATRVARVPSVPGRS